MEYDFRTRTGSSYDSNTAYSRPPNAATSSPSPHPMYGQQPSLYPKIGSAAAGHGRNPPFHPAPTPPASSGTGIRVAIKPEYRITPPPAMLPQVGEIPRSNFHFDFEFERNVLIEAVKENPNWSRIGIDPHPPKATDPTSSYMQGPTVDPIVNKYMAAGLSREAVPLAVANFGDNPTKVKEFANGYTLLREMGFSSNNVGEALLMHDNDTDKALAHLLNGTS
ncbi:hypothetical protein ACJIZ3_022325 [Penstemon smallii]|uniref:UBA domain-containing protein n=1 Tax=Penstemon smallii TaxID=265156 RepID=A0ABD3TL01_9LAMI